MEVIDTTKLRDLQEAIRDGIGDVFNGADDPDNVADFLCRKAATVADRADALEAELADVREELDATIDQRDALDQEVIRLNAELAALKAMISDAPQAWVGVDADGEWIMSGGEIPAFSEGQRVRLLPADAEGE